MKKIKVQQHNSKPVYTPWQNQEGVFKTKTGEFICRVKTAEGFSTISKHVTEELAEAAYREHKPR